MTTTKYDPIDPLYRPEELDMAEHEGTEGANVQAVPAPPLPLGEETAEELRRRLEDCRARIAELRAHREQIAAELRELVATEDKLRRALHVFTAPPRRYSARGQTGAPE